MASPEVELPTLSLDLDPLEVMEPLSLASFSLLLLSQITFLVSIHIQDTTDYTAPVASIHLDPLQVSCYCWKKRIIKPVQTRWCRECSKTNELIEYMPFLERLRNDLNPKQLQLGRYTLTKYSPIIILDISKLF